MHVCMFRMRHEAADPGYTDALYLQALEAEYLRFAADPGNDELSLEVISVVRNALPTDADPDGYADQIREFVAEHREKLALTVLRELRNQVPPSPKMKRPRAGVTLQ